MLAPCASAIQLQSADPNWIGNNVNFGTTEGNDFWLTFMNNSTLNPETYPDITFELKVAVSAREQTHVYFEVDGTVVHDHLVSANETYIYDMKALYSQIYLLESESNTYKGVHVYTDESDKVFSCFNYSRNGEAGESSRDASLIIPTRHLGMEYLVQTYYEDTYSSQFAVVATEDNTTVTITPTYQTLGGKPQGTPFTVLLSKKGDAYLVASAIHQSSNVNVDLSGSRICADKPIAVFNGNQQTSIPFDESYSKDFLSEQIIPIKQWGTDFYLATLGSTNENYFILTAAYDSTQIEINSYFTGDNSNTTEVKTLMAGETLSPYSLDDDFKETTIHSDKPIMCYAYTTSAARNSQCSVVGRTKVCINYGDPANALMPSWMHRVKSMNFFTHDLDPFSPDPNNVPPQKYFVYVVTRTSDTGKLTIDGQGDYSASFTPFHGAPEMSYASIEVTNPDKKYHTIESSGDGFVGMVYALTGAQGYLYTLGYNPEPFRDTLFVANTEAVMSPASYDVEPRLAQGWYQRQWDEWKTDQERLDTVQVCEGETVKWLIQSPLYKQTDPVDWYIYHVTGTEKTIFKSYTDLELLDSRKDAHKDEATAANWLFRWEHTFELPNEDDLPPEERTPFLEYEVQAVLHHSHLFCTDLPDETDTLRSVVRVARTYHDTTYQIICMGDTLKFFEDSLPHQTYEGEGTALHDEPASRVNQRDSTLFIGDKTDGDNTHNFEWKARPGENVFTRHYQTRYGCDSTYTLYLFVCDTFRTIDTLHLCKNEAITYLPDDPEHRKKYKGAEYEGDGYLVTRDTVDTILAKTKFCACQLEPYRSKYPAFEGCDSIFELHIFLHDIYRDTIVDTMCYNRKPDSVYVWPIQKGTDEKRITKADPGMHYDAGLRAWEGFFSDTLRTVSCPQCNKGKGCDSINVLHLFIPEPFYHDTIDSICLWDYDKETRTQDTNIYRWNNHRAGAEFVELPESGDYYDSCLTRFGCDSIYHLKLHYTQPFLHVDQHMMANNQTYYWHGKLYGPFDGEEFKNRESDTILYFHNDNENQTNPVNGCDSIYRLELRISDTFMERSYRTICDIDSIHWRDTVIVGYKWASDESFDIRLTAAGIHSIDDSLQTLSLPRRDSIYRLIVTQYPTHEKTLDRVDLCQDQTVYEWLREDDGNLIQRITLPQKNSYPFDTVYTDTLTTKTGCGCDSILHLPIRIYPTYKETVTAVICESELPYVWELRDSEGTHDRTVQIPEEERGTLWTYAQDDTLHTIHGCDSIVHLDLTVKPTTYRYMTVVQCANEPPCRYGEKGKTASVSGTYRDTLVTKNRYGCDSIVVLDLTVNPVYSFHTDTAICQGAAFTWRRHEGHPLKDVHGNDVPTIPTNHSGLFIYTDSMKTAAGCDSVWTLNLRVEAIYTSPVSITQRRFCENDTLHFYNRIVYGAKWPEKPDGITGLAVPAGSFSLEFDSTYTDTTMTGCDSIVQHHFTLYPTRSYLTTDTVCQDTVDTRYTWTNHPDVEIYRNVAGTRTYVDSLKSGHTDCNCDSIFELQLTVLPSYHRHFSHVMSDEEVYTWENVTYGGVKTTKTHNITVTQDTIIIAGYETKKTGTHSCDSILELTLRIGKVTRDTTYRYVCADETSYEWMRADKEGVMELRKTISGTDLPAVETHKYFYDSLRTAMDFDSIFVLDLYRAPTHFPDTTAHVCQGEPFVWKRHDGVANHVEDAYGNPVAQISTEHHGEFIYYDRLQTDSFGCDSVWTLHLYVDTVYAAATDTAICQNETFTWPRHEGHTLKDVHGNDVTDIPTDHIGTYTYTDSMQTIDGCDSIWTLRLRVDTVYTTPVTVTERSFCENDTLHFYDRELFGAKSPLKPAGEAGYGVPTDEKYYTFELSYTDSTIHGCDSAVTHRFTVYPTYYKEHPDSVCQGSAYVWEKHTSEYIWDVRQGKRIRLTEIPTNLKSGVEYTYIDSLHTDACPACREGQGGCDSIWVLKLRVDSVYYREDRITMSDEESRKWQHTVYVGSKVNTDTLDRSYWFTPEETDHRIVRIPEGQILNEFDAVYPTIHECDSTIHLRLLVGPTFRDTIERWTCDNEPFHWYHEGDPEQREARTDLTILTPGLYYDSLVTKQFGFDSIYVLVLHNYPTFRKEAYDTICQGSPYIWLGHTESDRFYSVEARQWVDRTAIPTDVAGHFTYIDSLKTHEPGTHPDRILHDGCDSVWTLHLFIPETYHFYNTVDLCENDSAQWQGMLFTGSQYTAYGKTYDAAGFDSILTDLPEGTYHRDIRRPTVYNCDSVYHLTLHVHEVAHTDSVDSVCQGTPFFNPNWNRGQGVNMDTRRVGTYVSVDTISSLVTGCDSIVTLTLRVDSVYDYRQHYIFCQDTVNTEREWIDEEGHPHTFKMDVSRAGDFDFTEQHTTIHGCDSVYGVTWHVNPIYRFDSTYVICQNERISWQGKWYAGDEYGWGYERLQGDRYDTHRDSVYHHYVEGDSILTVGTYYDTVHFVTTTGCDSTFYLRLVVNPAGHFIRNEVACDRDGYHVFYTTDAEGEHTDTIFFSPTTRMYDETRKDTMHYEAERHLKAVNGGCDSTIHFHLTVHPTYEFVTRAKICWGDSYTWRGKDYIATGVYYDSIDGGTDYWHCDSVYVLELYMKPVTIVPIYDTICDDMTYEHIDTLWYTNGSHSLVETLVWKPGMTIPQTYTDVIFRSPIDGCDSIIYRYYLQINKTYLIRDTAAICSNESYTASHGHTYTGYEYELEPGEIGRSFDTVIVERLNSVHLCDSVFEFHATIHPAYRHIDYITICDDGEADWRDHHYEGARTGDTPGTGLAAGEYTFYDSLLTAAHDCDSIYELRLTVTPTYLFEERITKCADEQLSWRDQRLDHMPAGEHFLYDSLTTAVFGCDSVYHLYLTVLDTTFEIRHDSICLTESYDFHGVTLTQPGAYKDTTLNEWGCNHFTYLYLAVIEPTVPTAWTDSVCADDQAYDLYYTYTGEHDPIAYSVFYDEDGHANGFEDLIDIPITTPDELSVLTLPMPLRNGDKTQYPRPDYYQIRLVLNNGICVNPDLCATDTAIVLSYPSWLTEQRFGDVIALYNERYNGGYTWDSYQWYHGDEMLVGQTREYLYIPTGLVVGDQYHVRLTRNGETQDFQTCPITVVGDPVVNNFAPTMGYLSVVPTCIVTGNPVAHILSRKDGTYRVTTTEGQLVSEGVFRADVTPLQLPAVSGMYVVQLWSPDTPEEPYRSIKVIVKEKCENCNISF